MATIKPFGKLMKAATIPTTIAKTRTLTENTFSMVPKCGKRIKVIIIAIIVVIMLLVYHNE